MSKKKHLMINDEGVKDQLEAFSRILFFKLAQNKCSFFESFIASINSRKTFFGAIIQNLLYQYHNGEQFYRIVTNKKYLWPKLYLEAFSSRKNRQVEVYDQFLMLKMIKSN
ncbi:hypothetical protein BpHYR1_032458 [Brachionus plicatilis]|uniref:Uncharacterized protein n=1 Tax=Brachionus plicatilis TaxID=10195 RepID=A0A3M7SUT9_BRAPC|nr:hypothetical protein BpHYR1_032458 [Brachionus plicatilis]